MSPQSGRHKAWSMNLLSSINQHPVFLHETNKFIMSRTPLMMLFLIDDILYHLVLIGFTDRKCTISFLPREILILHA